MSTASHTRHQFVYALSSIAGLILLLVWMQGGFNSKVAPGTVPAADHPTPPPGEAFKVVAQELPELRQWPATISARAVAQVAPKVAARVLEITVRTGDHVKSGQILARLDQRELQAKLAQARAALVAAEAQAARAGADARRIKNLFDKEAATRQSWEAAQAAASASSAQTQEARAAITEVESLAGETTLRAPFDGAIVQRHLEPGDMALPGTPVLTLQTSQKMRIEAAIPESCSPTLRLGETLQARVGEIRIEATVEEIAPAADPQTRTVLIKAGIQANGAIQPGAFGWIEQACGARQVLLIPAQAVIRSGQLESVHVLENGRDLLRHVRTGKAHDGLVEVHSGLREGELIWVRSGS